MRKLTFLLILMVFMFFCVATVTAQKVSRVKPDTNIDLSGYWNDADVRIVCEMLIKDCLNSARVDQAIKAKKGTPIVIVGRFRNESSEHIDTSIISTIMENTIFNSGKLDFVAGGSTREDLRTERMEQQNGFTSDTTASVLGKEIGADFMLTGSVKLIIDKAGNQTVRKYFVTAELTDIETNARIWMQTNSEIKKVVVQPKNKL